MARAGGARWHQTGVWRRQATAGTDPAIGLGERRTSRRPDITGPTIGLVIAALVWGPGIELRATQFPAVGHAPRLTLRLAGLKAPVAVYRDDWGIPHIYAGSTEDAYFALGYLHASDRLFQMELFRRRASGTLAEIFGKSLLEDDIFVRQLGIRRSVEALWESPDLDTKIKLELVAYSAGVNARLHELEGKKLPEPFRALGITPAAWTPVDSLAFPKYMAWDQSGTDTDLWMGMLAEKLGQATVDELFPLDRPYEISTTPGEQISASRAIIPALKLSRGFLDAALEIHHHFVSGRFASAYALGSNNWVIDGKKSATGKPMLANDPHLGLSLPSIWYATHLVAPGLNVTGVTFAGFPYIIIGHNDRIAWGLTNMQADAVDYFLEKTEPQRPHQYFYKGAWREMSRLVEEIPVRGEQPARLEIESTVHGPLITGHGARVALEWTGLGPTQEAIAFERLNHARNVADFKAALHFLAVPALNVIYADVDGNIAIAPHGALPIRKRGFGRVPVDGPSGEYDWTGTIPDDQLPFAANPAQHYLASANGRPAPVGYPYYLGWMWDASYRTRRIHRLLRTHDQITIEQMERFQTDTHDAAAEAFVPVLIAAYGRKPYGGKFIRRAMDELRRWNFEVTPESVAPTIWTVWFEKFRQAVWQDDFDAARVEPWPGAWGYDGSNERQPELEVLEFLTRENPGSAWFDDVRTSQKESRDDIFERSFLAAIEQLRNERGENINDWKWGKTNVLRLHSMTRQPALDRGGMPLGGDSFTLDPGGGGGAVTGGASWRMVVDLGNLSHSFGVYPGGQSDDPASPHYDDLVKSWVEGHYVPLLFCSSPGEFEPGQIESILVLEPGT